MKTLLCALVGVVTLASPLAAAAHDWDHDRDDYGRYEHRWHDHDRWRDHDRGSHWGWDRDWRRDRYAYGYGPRCYVQTQAYRDWYGRLSYRQYRVCR